MADLGKTIQDDKGAKRPGTDEGGAEGGRSRSAGTDRDFDETGESANQGHGHAPDRPGGSDDAGRSNERMTEADRQERDLGGPGG